MTIRVVGKNTLSFDDGSLFEIPDLWVTALRDKLRNEKLTFEDFISDFDNSIRKRWDTRTTSDKSSPAFGRSRLSDSMVLNEGGPNGNKAELAENELYHYLRGYILGLLLFEMTGGLKRAIVITNKGMIEYPPRKRKRRTVHVRKGK